MRNSKSQIPNSKSQILNPKSQILNSPNPKSQILNSPILKSHLYLLSFLEGALVMAVELIGAKMLAPYFGTSLIIWSTVIGVTLFMLTCGYYIGGILSRKKESLTILFYVLIITSVLMAMMPSATYTYIKWFENIEFHTSAVLVALLLIGPPLFGFGIVSPLIIQNLTTTVTESGKAAGNIYALSTTGGIIMTFFIGFFIIPNYGLSYPVLVLGFLLVIITLLVYQKKGNMLAGIISILILFLFSFMIRAKNKSKKFTDLTVVNYSEGLMGQLKVIDRIDEQTKQSNRYLSINGIPQTRIYNNPRAQSLWKYVHVVSIFSSLKPIGSSALLFGFGAGSVAGELLRLGYKLDAVDIDSRMIELASKYFYFDSSKVNMIIDDARHFINLNKKKYDVITMDLLNGEVQPSYVFSVQSFTQLKNSLKPDGIIVIEFQELGVGKNAEVYLSIYKTIQKAGYNVYICPLPSDGVGDIVFIASLKPVDFKMISKERQNDCCSYQRWLEELLKNPIAIDTISPKLSSAHIFDDDRPLMDHLNIKTMQAWRNTMLDYFTKLELKKGYKLFE